MQTHGEKGHVKRGQAPARCRARQGCRQPQEPEEAATILPQSLGEPTTLLTPPRTSSLQTAGAETSAVKPSTCGRCSGAPGDQYSR